MVGATSFEFATAGRIIFGRGSVRQAAGLVLELGRRPLVITGRHADRVSWLAEDLEAAGAEFRVIAIDGEPDVGLVARSAEYARSRGFDVVAAVGGGSVLDAAKAIAAFAANPGDPLDYLEVVGRGQPLKAAPLPAVAIPTTAGTGSEVTRNAVLSVPEPRVKVSLRHPLMLPRVAIVDPALTDSLPPSLTATTGLDALTQLIEPFLSSRATPLTDALCRSGIPRVARSLRRACEHAGDTAARDDMALGSLLGGLALANAGLGAVHGLAAPIGGLFGVPHGAVCAALLPHVCKTNLRALRARHPDHPALARFDEVAAMLTARADATADEAIEWLTQECQTLDVRPLSAHGVTDEALPEIVAQAGRAASMKANPVSLTGEELAAAIRAAL